MTENATHFRGLVQNGTVVLPAGLNLPDGTEVEVVLPPMPPEWAEEMQAWELASAETWTSFLAWEREHADDAG